MGGLSGVKAIVARKRQKGDSKEGFVLVRNW